MCVDSNTPANNDNVTNAGNQGQPQAGSDHAGTKMAVLNLPYFQQGDDLSKYLNDTGNVVEALEAHACRNGPCRRDAAGDRRDPHRSERKR